jgi:hypothetical protein
MLGFFRTIRLIRQLDKGQIEFRSLPFDQMREIDVVRIMRFHGVYFQQLPKHFKTDQVIRTVIMASDNGVRTLGLDVVNDEYAMFAITKRGRPAFQALNDKSKTEAVCLHAVKQNPLTLSDVKVENRTQDMANIAFALNPEAFAYIRDSHITPPMMLKLFEKGMRQHVRRIDHLITQEVADYVMEERPEYIDHVPERFLTPYAMALNLKDHPDRLGLYKDVKKCVEAIAISVEQLLSTSPIWKECIAGKSKPEIIEYLVAEYKNESLWHDRTKLEIFYCTLYRLNALDPEKLAAQAQDMPVLIDILQLMHGTDVALKFFPKAPNRGKWLMGELGL